MIVNMLFLCVLLGGPEMRIEMFQDEFDKYFARAALGHDIGYDPEAENRRGSLPSATLKAPETVSSSSMRRTASCKYPSRRRRSRERSTSPRNMSPSPKQRPGSINLETQGLVTGDSYIHEATLRAPSPGLSMKCHSAPHSRSSSWKKSKRPRGRDADQDRLEGRPRTGSIPLEDTIYQLERLKLLQSEDICPVRSFTTSARGLINRGDSFKRISMSSVASDGGSQGSGTGEGSNRSRAVSVNSTGSASQASSTGHTVYKVMIMGDHGVGKTAVIQQFMTSDYMGAIDTSFGK